MRSGGPRVASYFIAPVVLLSALSYWQDAARLAIVDIRAHPWCGAEGRLASQDLLGDPPATLWNAIIGEGDLQCASNATQIVAVVRGVPAKYMAGTRVRLSATFETRAGDSTVVTEQQIGVTGAQGQYHVALWLEGTGCVPVRLRAWEVGDERGARAEKLDFHCGE